MLWNVPAVLPPLKLPICILHRLFCVPCFYSLVSLFALCNRQENKFTLFPVVAGLDLHIATRRRNPFLFFSGSKKELSVSKNHVWDTEGKEKLCLFFSWSLIMFYQWWVGMPCLSHQGTPGQSPCSKIVFCFPATTEKIQSSGQLLRQEGVERAGNMQMWVLFICSLNLWVPNHQAMWAPSPPFQTQLAYCWANVSRGDDNEDDDDDNVIN